VPHGYAFRQSGFALQRLPRWDNNSNHWIADVLLVLRMHWWHGGPVPPGEWRLLGVLCAWEVSTWNDAVLRGAASAARRPVR
jgi:hypothetical protein